MHVISSRIATSTLTGLFLWAVLPTAVFAHEGHGAVAAEKGVMHWLLEPQHGLSVLAAALLIVLAKRAMAPPMRRIRTPERRR